MQKVEMNISNRPENKSLPEVPDVPELKLSIDPIEENSAEELDLSENTQEDNSPAIKLDDNNIAEVISAFEAMLFVSKEPLRVDKVKNLLGLNSILTVRRAAKSLQKFYDDTNRAFELREIAEGYLLQTKSDFELVITQMRRQKRKMMLTQNALTTLSIVAYKQPITRSEIDSIRGANSSHHIRTLLDKMMIKVVGKKSVPGSPRLFGTTRFFLECFGLKSITELPQTTESYEEDMKKIDKAEKIDKKNQEKKIPNNDNNDPDIKEVKGYKREFYNPDEIQN